MLLRKKLRQGETEAQIIANLPENNDHIANYILEHNGQLPPQPMFEKHPYLDDFELQNFDKYIIGTFPPISYLYYKYNFTIIRQPNNGSILRKPAFSFYHGNKGLLWDYFLNADELNNFPFNKNLIPEYLKNILADKTKINYCDIVNCVRRELVNNRYKGSDKLLHNITPNFDLITQILNNPKAKYLMFNTASIYGMSGIQSCENGFVSLDDDAKSFDLFLRTLQDLGFKTLLSFDNGNNWVTFENLNTNQRKEKLFFKLKMIKNSSEEKEFFIITPFSPAVAQRVNILNRNPIVANWRNNNNMQNTKMMLSQIMIHFRNNNWDALQAMNVNI
jgi:hypothetical protein